VGLSSDMDLPSLSSRASSGQEPSVSRDERTSVIGEQSIEAQSDATLPLKATSDKAKRILGNRYDKDIISWWLVLPACGERLVQQ